MKKEQLEFLRSTFAKNNGNDETLAKIVNFVCNDYHVFSNASDLVFFDDEHELLHVVGINEDGNTQTFAPVKVMSCDYGILFYVKALYNPTDIESVLANQLSFLDDKKKDAVRHFIANLGIQTNETNRPKYFNDEPVFPDNIHANAKNLSSSTVTVGSTELTKVRADAGKYNTLSSTATKKTFNYIDGNSYEYIDVKVTATNLVSYKNGVGTDGYWVGFHAGIPSGATKLLRAYTTSNDEPTFAGLMKKELTEYTDLAAEHEYQTYLNVGVQRDRWVHLKWLDNSDNVVAENYYHLDCHGVSIVA